MAMHKKSFKFADLCITFTSGVPLQNSEFFESFMTEETADIEILVRSESLPEFIGETVYEDKKRRLVKNDEGSFLYTSFFDNEADRYKSYACFASMQNNYTLYVDYPEIRDILLTEGIDFPNILIEHNMALFHCCFVDFNGDAIIFTAPKQGGKSTQGNLWELFKSAQVINGDRCILSVKDNEAYACGVPYCGTSRISINKYGKIKAIVVLEKAKSNNIERLNKLDSFLNILPQITYRTWDKESIEKATDLVSQICENTPIYRLSCLPDNSAVELLFNTLYGGDENE
jgi:hypothetical protein